MACAGWVYVRTMLNARHGILTDQFGTIVQKLGKQSERQFPSVEHIERAKKRKNDWRIGRSAGAFCLITQVGIEGKGGMTDGIILIVAWALVQALRALPGIVWSLRCPPHSTRYSYPLAPPRRITLGSATRCRE